jgi:hypothetical protein
MTLSLLGVICGLAGPLLFAGTVVSLTILQYDFLRGLGWHPLLAPTFDWPSGLALGPYGGFMTAAFILSGFMMSVFALSLRASLIVGTAVQLPYQPNAARIGSTLLALAGLALTGLAFTTDPTIRSTPATWHGRLHDGSFVLLGLTLLPAMLFLGRAFRRDPRWASLAVYTWVTAALIIPTFILKGAAFYVFLGAVLLWGEVIALRLIKISALE